jgi:hypothetical protein
VHCTTSLSFLRHEVLPIWDPSSSAKAHELALKETIGNPRSSYMPAGGKCRQALKGYALSSDGRAQRTVIRRGSGYRRTCPTSWLSAPVIIIMAVISISLFRYKAGSLISIFLIIALV